MACDGCNDILLETCKGCGISATTASQILANLNTCCFQQTADDLNIIPDTQWIANYFTANGIDACNCEFVVLEDTTNGVTYLGTNNGDNWFMLGGGSGSSLTVRALGGVPTVVGVNDIIVPDGSLGDFGGGTIGLFPLPLIIAQMQGINYTGITYTRNSGINTGLETPTFDTLISDVYGGLDIGAGSYTIPFDGFYEIHVYNTGTNPTSQVNVSGATFGANPQTAGVVNSLNDSRVSQFNGNLLTNTGGFIPLGQGAFSSGGGIAFFSAGDVISWDVQINYNGGSGLAQIFGVDNADAGMLVVRWT